MKQRLTVSETGELIARDGTTVGRLTSLTIELGGVGGEEASGTKEEEESSEGGVGGGQTSLLGGELPRQRPQSGPSKRQRVWAHYQATVPNAGRRSLDSARTTCIDRALRVRSVEVCCEAIDALAESPWHLGENPQRRPYLDIQYALGQKSESADERIDRMVREHRDRRATNNGRTPVESLLTTLSPEGQKVARNWMNDVEAWVRNPDNPGLKLTAESAMRQLRDRAKLEPVIEGRELKEWRRV